MLEDTDEICTTFRVKLNFRMFFVLVHSIEIGSFFQFLMKMVACYGREGHKTG